MELVDVRLVLFLYDATRTDTVIIIRVPMLEQNNQTMELFSVGIFLVMHILYIVLLTNSNYMSNWLSRLNVLTTI